MDGLKDEISILNKNNNKSNKIYDELKMKMNEEVNFHSIKKKEKMKPENKNKIFLKIWLNQTYQSIICMHSINKKRKATTYQKLNL